MKLKSTLVVSLALLASTGAFANKDLAAKSGCLACHAADKKLVGPSYQEVAKKYAGQKGADATLAANIKKGGQGKWGAVPMPAQNISDADAATVAKWILAGGQ